MPGSADGRTREPVVGRALGDQIAHLGTVVPPQEQLGERKIQVPEMGDGYHGPLARHHLARRSIERPWWRQVFPACDDDTDPEEPAKRQPGADNDAVEAVAGLRPPGHQWPPAGRRGGQGIKPDVDSTYSLYPGRADIAFSVSGFPVLPASAQTISAGERTVRIPGQESAAIRNSPVQTAASPK